MDDQNGQAITVVVQNGRPDYVIRVRSDQRKCVGHRLRPQLSVAGYDASRDIPPNIVVSDAKTSEAYFNGQDNAALAILNGVIWRALAANGRGP
jgi:hypothetical protein